MKTYLITSGTIFGLITLAHVARVIWKNRSLATDPLFAALSVLTTGLSIWAWSLVAKGAAAKS